VRKSLLTLAANPVNDEDPTFEKVPSEMLLHVIRIAFRRSPPSGTFFDPESISDNNMVRAYSMTSREWAFQSPRHNHPPKTEEEKAKDLEVLLLCWLPDAPQVSRATTKNLYDKVSDEEFREVYDDFMRTILVSLAAD